MKNTFKEYGSFAEFTTDFLLTVMDASYAMIVVDYRDYNGLLASLQVKTINGVALHLDPDTYEGFENDIEAAKTHDGLIMVTVYDDGNVMGEAVLYSEPDAYVEGDYFVEEDAQSFLMKPVVGRMIPFVVSKDKI